MFLKKIAIASLTFGMVLFFFNIAYSIIYQNQDCLRCHNDPKLTMSGKKGNLESLQVDSSLFAQTLHGVYLLCVDCHCDADTTAHPNTGYKDVNCLACHSNLTGYYPPNSKQIIQRKGLKIPEKKMAKAAKSKSPKIQKQVALAKTLKSFKK